MSNQEIYIYIVFISIVREVKTCLIVDEPEPVETQLWKVCVLLISSPPEWLQEEKDMRVISKYWANDIQHCFVPSIEKKKSPVAVTKDGGRLLFDKDSEHLRSPSFTIFNTFLIFYVCKLFYIMGFFFISNNFKQLLVVEIA